MEVTGQLYNLMELDINNKVWPVLKKMCVRGWYAGETFRTISSGRRIGGEYLLYLLSCDGEPVAWGMSVKLSLCSSVKQLWLYTKPKYRKMGFQKNHIIPFWNRHSDSIYTFQEKRLRQRKTFKYVKNRNTPWSPTVSRRLYVGY